MPPESSDRLCLLESALALSPDGVVIVDAEQRPVYANDASRTIVRQALDPAVALTRQLAGFRLIGPDGQTAPPVDSPFALGLAGSVLRDVRAAFERPNGSEARVSIAVSPVRGGDGQIVGAVALIRDVGRLERVEEALRDTDERYHALLDAIPDNAHFKDAAGRYVLVNAAMAKSVRLSKDEIVGRSALEVHPPAIAPKIAADDELVLRTGITLDTEEVFAGPSGVMHHHVRKAPVRDSAGQVTGMVTVSRDVSERRRAEEALRQSKATLEATIAARTANLRESNERLRCELAERKRAERALLESEAKYHALFEAEADAVVVAEHETGRILDANGAACRLFGYGRDELLRMRNWELSAEPEKTTLATRQDSVHVPLRNLRRRDGTVISVEINANSLVLDGAPVQIAAIRDVTERLHADAYRRQFLDLAAHEMRTPITVLMGYLRLLAERNTSAMEDARLIRILQAQATRLGHLVRRVGDAARVQSGDVRLRMERLDLCTLVQETAEQTGVNTPDRAVIVRCASPVVVDVDRAWVREVLLNLLDNAVRYSSPGSPVEVEVSMRNRLASVSIRDHGPGIPPDQIPRLFEPYYQVDPMVRPTAGMGLGLYISREIARLHGGEISVESAIGIGSTFTFRLPVNREVGDARQ